MLNRDGELVDQQGLPVLTQGGGRIRVPNEQGKVGITRDGTIIVDGEDVGKLSVLDVANPQDLRRVGNSNYELPDPNVKPPQMAEPDVRQQFTESANVNAVHTMAMLIKTNRLFELNTRAIQAYKDMDDKAARDVGRIR
jgi:flagellar basal body rod protein FlgG